MKNLAKFAYMAACMSLASVAMLSCSVEAPFGSEEGVLEMRLFINSDLTRAVVEDQDLADNCVVYIYNDKGLVFKNKGLSNMPDRITLRQGHYMAEAWAGDSVPASFDSRFFSCAQPIDIVAGSNSVELTCRIANVVTSVNTNSIDDSQVRNLRVTASTSNGSLEFKGDDLKKKGYFMMPFDSEGNRDSTLNLKIEGENILGEPFSKSRTVENVKPAHEYVVNLSYDDTGDDPQGGGYLVVTIDDREIEVKSTVEIFAAPLVEGVGFDIDKQIIGEPGQFVGDRQVKVVAFDEITSFTLECKDADNLNLPAQAVDLKMADDATIAAINVAGITWDKEVTDVENNKDGHTRQLSYITFSEAYLNSLPARDSEYRIVLTATDGTGHDGIPGKTTTKTLRIAVGENAIVYEDPLILEDAEDPNDLMAIGARSAKLKASIKDNTATGLGIQYREVGTAEWSKVPLKATRSALTDTVTLNNLKPATTYEYKAYADGFEASDSRRFTTESLFVIPNASMEEWSNFASNNKVLIPGGGGERSFWDSGNHGSATLSVTLTQNSTDMFHSGTQSARLRSQFVGLGGLAGKFAAGNLFAGIYKETKGTNGVIEFGREYNRSHPTKLKVWANYRPGKELKGNGHDILENGKNDHSQIYVAFTNGVVTVDTSDTNSLFNSSADYVLGYGEVTWTVNIGQDGQLEEITIPIKWNNRANTVKPTHIIIVCSASKYGDFFTGCEGSTMYVDDFELIYDK